MHHAATTGRAAGAKARGGQGQREMGFMESASWGGGKERGGFRV